MYKHLFYKGYQAALRSGNWGGMPELGAAGHVATCAMMNALTLSFIAERVFNWDAGSWLRPEYKWFWSSFVVILTFSYYLWNSKYRRIVNSYESKTNIFSRIPPVLVIGFYFLSSALLMFIAAVYRNHGGPFK